MDKQVYLNFVNILKEELVLHQKHTNTNTGTKKAFYVFRRGVFGIFCKR